MITQLWQEMEAWLTWMVRDVDTDGRDTLWGNDGIDGAKNQM